MVDHAPLLTPTGQVHVLLSLIRAMGGVPDMSPSVSCFYITRVGSRFGVSYAATDPYWPGARTTQSNQGYGLSARYVSLGKLVLYPKGWE